MNVQQGQIWEVATDHFTGKASHPNQQIGDRRVLLKKGEKIEIRYPYAWHYRTEDGCYFQSDEPELLANCTFFGVIDEKVRWMNRASLEEILRLNLYQPNK